MRSTSRAVGAAAALLLPLAASAEELMPGVELGGSVTYTFEMNKSAGSDKRDWAQVGTMVLTPATYIYEPWLAQVYGTVYLNGTNNSMGYETLGVTGSITTSILPLSSFPVTVSYTRFNQFWQYKNEYDGASGGSSLAITSRVFDEDWSVYTTLATRDTDYGKASSDAQRSVNIEILQRFDQDVVQGSIAFDRVSLTTEATETIADSGHISVYYGTRPFEGVTTSSMTSLSFRQGSSPESEDTSIALQGVTTATWKPIEDDDWVVHGSLRTYSALSTLEMLSDGRTTIDSTDSSAYAAAATSYAFTPRLTANTAINGGYTASTTKTKTSGASPFTSASTTAAKALKQTDSQMSANSNSSLAYAAEMEEVLGFRWNWTTSGDVAMVRGDNTFAHREGVTAGQFASQTFDAPWGGTLNMSMSQTASMSYGSVGDVLMPLNHMITVSQSAADGEHWDMWHLSAIDSRIFGRESANYQVLNLQYSRGYDIDMYASISGSATLQLSRGESGGTSTGWVDSMAADLNYNDAAFFGIEGLNFSASYGINPKTFLVASDFGLVEDKMDGFARHRLSARLNWGLGKLSVGITGRVSYDGSEYDELILFQVMRNLF